MSIRHLPLRSLKEGCWVKLICGASYQHLPAIRDLALVYGLAGVDCIDVAADPAVVEAVRDAFQVISRLRQIEPFATALGLSPNANYPLLMVSFSDGEDPHFRKATLDRTLCPEHCPRPCESVCPADAIAFETYAAGIAEERCYGCGRCLPLCPIQNIQTVTRVTSPAAIAAQLLNTVDAIELHTQVGRYDAFMELWRAVQPYLPNLALVSISCQDDEDVTGYLWQLYHGLQASMGGPLPLPLIWQTDGRSMSGDIGKGTTHATLRFAQKVLQSGPPGFVQLAGGTNAHTVTKVHQLRPGNSFPHREGRSAMGVAPQPMPAFGGIAYGSFARRLITPFLNVEAAATSGSVSTCEERCLSTHDPVPNGLEASPETLIQAVRTAQTLVSPLKTFPTTGTAVTLTKAHRAVSAVPRTSCSQLPSPSFE